jgi:hypothetical protein
MEAFIQFIQSDIGRLLRIMVGIALIVVGPLMIQESGQSDSEQRNRATAGRTFRILPDRPPLRLQIDRTSYRLIRAVKLTRE